MNNQLIGKVYIELDNVSSTNNHAKKLLSQNKPAEGTAIFAHNQWKGKGQYGNRWISEPGQNIVLSVILHPKSLPLRCFFYLNIITSLAWIKWPNDIICHGSAPNEGKWLKIGGILVENTIEKDRIASSVLGIGINVNQEHFGENTANAGSLQTITQQSWALNPLLNDLFTKLDDRYNQLLAGHFDQLKMDYLKCLLGWYQNREYEDGEEQFTATLLDVQDDGQIQLLTNTGVHNYHFKEVTLLT